jgi:arsenite methyltransferase
MPKHNDEPRHARAGSEHGDVGPHGAHHGAEMDHRFSGADKWTRILDDPARDAWQRPDDVLRALELTPAMTVADVGAGTGYFAVRLARAVPEGQVIATDVEVDMVRHLEARARRERLPNLRAVRATDAVSGLAANSVDRILVVHVWHHLADRRAFARGLAAALRPGGKTVVVDFNLGAERGPPPNLRLPPEAITGDLAAAGLTAKVSAVALPDQYLVEARRGP